MSVSEFILTLSYQESIFDREEAALQVLDQDSESEVLCETGLNYNSATRR